MISTETITLAAAVIPPYNALVMVVSALAHLILAGCVSAVAYSLFWFYKQQLGNVAMKIRPLLRIFGVMLFSVAVSILVDALKILGITTEITDAIMASSAAILTTYCVFGLFSVRRIIFEILGIKE